MVATVSRRNMNGRKIATMNGKYMIIVYLVTVVINVKCEEYCNCSNFKWKKFGNCSEFEWVHMLFRVTVQKYGNWNNFNGRNIETIVTFNGRIILTSESE